MFLPELRKAVAKSQNGNAVDIFREKKMIPCDLDQVS